MTSDLLRLTCWICMLLLPRLLTAQDAVSPPQPSSVMDQYRTLDADGSGALSEGELLSLKGAWSIAGLRQRFSLFDLNRDGKLSFAEYATLPGIVPIEQRGPLHDPFEARFREKISLTLSRLVFPSPAKDLPRNWSGLLPPGTPLSPPLWDVDSNGNVTMEEAQRGLELAWGLRRQDGSLTRTPSGLVFNGSYFHYLDADHDRRLTRLEFVPKYHAGPKQSEVLFQKADKDGDGTLSLPELDAAGLLLSDIPAAYLEWDTDHSGSITQAELLTGPDWQAQAARHLLPGFDDDGDGQLSLEEYRLSSLGNPIVNWNDLRVDTNANGFLQWDEFLSDKALWGTALAGEYFTRWDTNRDGQLSLKELPFQVQEERLATARLLALRDRDEDGLLSLPELFTPWGAPLLSDPQQVLIPRHLRLFKIADTNHDQLISLAEAGEASDLANAIRVELSLRKKSWPRFQKSDRNRDGTLSLGEWLDGHLAPEHLELRRQFSVCDFDGNWFLDFREFACLPSVGQAFERPDVPDPIELEVDRLHQSATAALPIPAVSDQDRLQQAAPFLLEAEMIAWDVDRDGRLNSQEIQGGLDLCYGIRDATGMRLRRPTGQVFDYRLWGYSDSDRSGQLSRAEFLAKYWKKGAEAEEDFSKTDLNRDGQLSLSEALTGWVFWVDLQYEFQRFDTDKNAFIARQELMDGALAHQKGMAEFAFPAFDLDRDGQLSFIEFRGCPLANPALDYSIRRWDTDRNGTLSLDEFHPGKTRQFLGLSHYFYSRLDSNQDGQLSQEEFSFHSSPAPADVEPGFATLDTDGSGALSEGELLSLKGAWSIAGLRQRFSLFDLNRDGKLSFAEYATLPGIVPIEQRGPLHDPFEARFREKISLTLSRLAFPSPAKDLPRNWSGLLPPGTPLSPPLWDVDSNGNVTMEEAQRGLELAWGLRRQDGALTRTPSGLVFNGSYFHYLDADHDRRLTRIEFVPRYHAGPKQSEVLFQKADKDGDGTLSLPELDAAGLLLSDIPAAYLEWDTDHSGSITQAELLKGPDWQAQAARHLLPGFDDDGDGQLSLEEYRLSPLGNPIVNWNDLRVDTNADGFLQLDEFLSDKALWGTALAGEYFTRWDTNRDGQLSLKELPFQVQEERLATARLLALRDRDDDGLLSLPELFTPWGAPLLSDPQQVLIPRHLRLFKIADTNHDQLISLAEAESLPSLLDASQLETQLRHQQWPAFQRRDANHDGQLSTEEWLEKVPAAGQASFIQEFRIADFDASGTLSFAEFACTPSASSLHHRPDVPDPIEDEWLRVLRRISEEVGNTPSGFTPVHVAESAGRQLPFLKSDEVTAWDRDINGTIDSQELRRGLAEAMGISHRHGCIYRRPNGQVFDLRTYAYADVNHDGLLNTGEFSAKYWKKGAEAEADFARCDANGDRELSLGELLGSDLFWMDTQYEFRRFDSNHDGWLSEAELQQQSRGHELRMAKMTWPAFDADQDGRLSFLEFRASPLANPLLDFDARRWDTDFDGQLSLAEFHGADSLQLLGLSWFCFHRLDRNRDQFLSIDECSFDSDLKKQPRQVVFHILDQDRNDRLEPDELLARIRPRKTSERAQRHFQRRSAEVEDAFLASDLNHDRMLSLEEFIRPEAPVASSITGATFPRPEVRIARSFSAGPAISWRLVGLIIANLCILIGVAWWYLRR